MGKRRKEKKKKKEERGKKKKKKERKREYLRLDGVEMGMSVHGLRGRVV